MHVNAMLMHSGDALGGDGCDWGRHCNPKRER